MKKQILKEETSKEIFEAWEQKTKSLKTIDDLSGFIKSLLDEYEHDYGTIIHACFHAMMATFRFMNNGPQGGVTGFQASCLGWMFVKNFIAMEDGPMKLLTFREMLYPAYADNFRKNISKDTWEFLQKEAKKNLEDTEEAHPKVVEHWKSIVAGEVPFGFKVVEEVEE